jgi:hypothetical protein
MKWGTSSRSWGYFGLIRFPRRITDGLDLVELILLLVRGILDISPWNDLVDDRLRSIISRDYILTRGGSLFNHFGNIQYGSFVGIRECQLEVNDRDD